MANDDPGFFRRLFCLGGQVEREVEPTEWMSSHSAAQQHQQLYAKAKALDVVDNDVDYHYHGLKLTQPVIDPASMKRVHRAQLPGQDAERLVETLGKIAAIAKSRQEFARDLEDVSEQLRRSEFARERAESLAKARGVALMKCQEALSDAEEQQVQLSGLLRNALEQLGVGSPNASGMTVSRGAMNGHHAPTPHAQVYSNSRSSDHFRYANITPPSGRAPVSAARRTQPTPMTGFTVYSNPVSEDTGYDDFMTPSRAGTYYSDDDEDDVGGETGNSGHTGSQATIGAETAQKLAREVLPHLGSSEIAYLVEYNQNLKEHELRQRETEKATAQRRGDRGTVRETADARAMKAVGNTRAKAKTKTKTKTKTSTFVVGDEGSDGEFLIGAVGSSAYPDGIPSVERRRNAAARIVAKLNERLPQELHITSLGGGLA